MRKPFSQKKLIYNFSFYYLCSESKSKRALIQKRSEIKLKKQFFLTESKERH